MLADEIAVEQGHRTAAHLHELDHQRIGNRRLPGAREPREEHRESLPMPRRVRAAQLGDHGRKRKPLRYVETVAQAPPQLRARDVERARVLVDLVLGQVLRLVLDVHHVLERHHRDVELGLELLHEPLRVVRTIERLAVASRPGASVIAANDEVRAAIVLADDRVPDGLARSAHSHRERQQAQGRRLLGVVRQQMLVATHAREVIDVAGLRHADDGMQQQIRLDLFRGAKRELLVSAMHRITGLKRNDATPADFLEAIAQLLRRVAQMLEIVVHGRLDAAQPAAEIHLVAAAHEIAHAGMRFVGGAEHGARFLLLVRPVDAFDLHRGNQDALAVAQRDDVAFLELVGERGGHIERDRHRPEDAAREPHVGQHLAIVLLSQETLERRKRAVEQQLDVAQLPHVQIPRRQIACSGFLLARRDLPQDRGFSAPLRGVP